MFWVYGLMEEAGKGVGKGSRKNDFQQGRRGMIASPYASLCLILRFALHLDSSLFI